MKNKFEQTVRKRLGMSLIPALSAAAAIVVLGTAALTFAGADEELRNLASELVRLRTEIEALNSDLDLKKDEMKVRMQTLTAQKAELEAQVRREELRVKQLEQALEKEKARASSQDQVRDYVKPAAAAQVEKIIAYMRAGLPFRADERQAEIRRIEKDLSSGLLAPESALARMWASLEDEFRLTRETGVYRQTIVVDGQEYIADVARVGMTLMYFQLADGRSGMAVQKGGAWTWQVAYEREDKKRIDYLFDSLRKRIREGYYELPNPYEAKP